MGPILGGSPRIRFGANVNIACDGNSLTAGVGGYPWPNSLKAKTAFTGCTVSNFASAGHTTQQMISGAGEVDAAWVDGKTNVLVAWEGTNSICNVGRTAAQAAQDMADYIAGRLALHPWIILLGTCLPRQTNAGQAATTAQNAVIEAYNALLRANYRAYGAKGMFDVRAAGSPFNLADYQMATFESAYSSALWADSETGNHIHLSSAGYHVLDDSFIEPALKRLPAR